MNDILLYLISPDFLMHEVKICISLFLSSVTIASFFCCRRRELSSNLDRQGSRRWCVILSPYSAEMICAVKASRLKDVLLWNGKIENKTWKKEWSESEPRYQILDRMWSRRGVRHAHMDQVLYCGLRWEGMECKQDKISSLWVRRNLESISSKVWYSHISEEEECDDGMRSKKLSAARKWLEVWRSQSAWKTESWYRFKK